MGRLRASSPPQPFPLPHAQPMWRTAVDRRDFLTTSGLAFGGLAVPSMFGHAIAAEQLQSTLDVSVKKSLADAALGAARDAGASYCDVRIGRYLQQFVITRADKVQNVVNTESTGLGVLVIADGVWGFSATNTPTPGSVFQEVCHTSGHLQ